MSSNEIDFDQYSEMIKENTSRKRKIAGESLDVDYMVLFPKPLASLIMEKLEKSIQYLSPELSKVKVFGKWYQIPRQQGAYGDVGTSYRFSGQNLVPKTWTPLLLSMKNILQDITGINFNFVLINRYRSGNDHVGEHKDDERELDENAPIASLSFGQQRKFIFKHQNSRKKGPDKQNIPKIEIDLEHGSLLLMNPPTNRFWYHSLPPKKNAPGVRINLTFRKIQ